MIIEIDYRSDTPVERQIADAIILRALSGALEPRSALPDVRELALQLQLNPNTVEYAYALLRAEGIARRAPDSERHLVADPPADLPLAAQDAFARALRGLLERARRAGLSPTRLRRLFEDVMEAIDRGH